MKNASGESKKSTTKRMTNIIQVTAVKFFLMSGNSVDEQYGQVKAGDVRWGDGSLGVPHLSQKRTEYSITVPQPEQ